MRSILIFLLLLLFLGAGAGGALFYLNSATNSVKGQSFIFRVEKGESLSTIAYRLQRNNLLRSALLLKLFSRFKKTESAFKSGTFRIQAAATTADIHDLLVAGNQNEVRVTLPEGWTIKKIAGRLVEKRITTAEDFESASREKTLIKAFGIPADSLEGYLFPDTYYFPEGFPASVIVEQMVENFFRHLEDILPDYDDWSEDKLHERIIMASIIEREYRIAEEAPLIASVFYNRLKYNIGLESCATLEYIITEVQEKPHPEYLTIEHKQIDSAYNTYKWAGLPPGPISNPGVVALKASFDPAKTNYWYFLLKDPEKGRHFFSNKLEEHNTAKYFYLKK